MRRLLLPFSWLFGAFVKLRNHLYDTGRLKSFSFDIPVISVGNLNTGGTGKTPHCLFLLQKLQHICKPGFVSRGYKRKTQGRILADKHSSASDIGDEPKLVKYHHEDIPVMVGAERIMAIPELLMQVEGTNCIVLDDAFQHRKVVPALSILLTEYADLYTRDYLLPAGNLREHSKESRRADIIIVSKCPQSINLAERQAIRRELSPNKDQILLFSRLKYMPAYHLLNKELLLDWKQKKNILLCCGIARRQALIQYLNSKDLNLTIKAYSDHFYFLEKDLKNIDRLFNTLQEDTIILTTEKDAMRFLLHEDWIRDRAWPIYALPIQVAMSDDDNELLFGELERVIEKPF